MVKTRSTENYSLYIKELKKEFKDRYPDNTKEVNKFISHVNDRYKKIGRVFLDKSLMWKLRDDYAHLKKGNIIAYLCVGLGNVGKTTLMKNIMYFIDKEFSGKFLAWSFMESVKLIQEVEEKGLLHRSILTDEPNDPPHASSREGRFFRQVLGQLRQMAPCLGYCSTDFVDVPPTVMRKLTGIFYLKTVGHFVYIRNYPEFNEYPLNDIRAHYQKEGYKVFDTILKKYNFLEGNTYGGNVLDFVDKKKEKEYLKEKKSQLSKSIKSYLGVTVPGSGDCPNPWADKQARHLEIIKLYNGGMTRMEIEKKLKATEKQVIYALRKRHLHPELSAPAP